MRGWIADLQLVLRQLRRSPGFVLTAVATLTMAIAANVVVYGVANALIFHPLPVPNPQQLVQIQNPGFDGISVSYPNYLDLRNRTRSMSGLAAMRLTRLAIGVDGATDPAWGFVVSGNYFDVLGVRPQLGRLLTPEDDLSINGSPVAVLSDSTWRLRFHADPAVIGKVITVAKHPFTVVGVASRGFHGTERIVSPQVWLPFHDGPQIDGYDQFEYRGSTSLWLVGRLRPGVTRADADAELRNISAAMAHDYPKEDEGSAFHTSTPGLIGDSLGKPIRAFVAGVMAMAMLVLLAACANLGVLFSSRTADRARELGIRLAIGSSRSRILRQLATEAVVVALLGGAVAAFLATALLGALARFHPPTELPIALGIDADWTVYAVAAALALLTGLVFGLLPARQIWRTDPNTTMRGSGSTASTARSHFRSALLVVQIALCCLLVTASFVALRGLQRTFTMPLGFNPEGVTLATIDVGMAGYNEAAQPVVQQRLLIAAQVIPGVTSAAFADNTPLSLNTSDNGIYAPGTTAFDHAHVRFQAQVYSISPNYFHTAGTPLLAGRDFTPHDAPGSPIAIVVNEAFARMLFGTTDIIGRHIPRWDGKPMEIVGLVPDGKYRSLSEDPLPAYFRAILQSPASTAVLIVRSSRPPAETVATLHKTIESIDPAIPIFSDSSWPDALSLVTFPARAATVALGVLGALAIMLAITGIFGVASYTVARGMRELGIRVALGANAFNVLRAALGRMAVQVGIGSAAGLLLGFAVSRLLSSVVYHATAADPLVLVAVALTMAALGAVSSALPARRALRVNPAILLKEE